jgi:transcriptional regulator with XRE-family HTH domain
MPVSASYRTHLQRLGAVVRARRMALGYSQESFGELCGLDRTYIGEVERGEVNLSTRHLVRIARALKIKVGALWTEAGL